MTISPPANVKLAPDEPARVLGKGIDTLVLALDIRWTNPATFEKLAELKTEAKVDGAAASGRIQPADKSAPWLYNVKPHGGDGYEWLLVSHDITMKIGKWAEPGSRPSVMVEIRSEPLWTHGPVVCVERVLHLIASIGGELVTCKVSRADLCVDVLLPASIWHPGLTGNFVKRAKNISIYKDNERFTGIHIGKGKILARLYDKVHEIRSKSHKYWMFDVWGFAPHQLDAQHKVIRVEYQFRREPLKETGISSFEDLMAKLPGLWAYATREWFKVHDDPKKHHTQQQVLPWWAIVQGGMDGSMQANPLIRAKAIALDEHRNAQQILGNLITVVALQMGDTLITPDETLDMRSHLASALQAIKTLDMDDREFTRRVKQRQAKFHRLVDNKATPNDKHTGIGVSSRKRYYKGAP